MRLVLFAIVVGSSWRLAFGWRPNWWPRAHTAELSPHEREERLVLWELMPDDLPQVAHRLLSANQAGVEIIHFVGGLASVQLARDRRAKVG